MKALLAYVPVLHQGYISFFKRHATDGTKLYIFSQQIIDRFDWLKRKDIRALDPNEMRRAVVGLEIFEDVLLLDENQAAILRHSGYELVFSNEEESREVASSLFNGCPLIFEDVFLRWDKPRALDGKNAEGFPVTREDLHRVFMKQAFTAADRSSDWYLHVGAVLVSGDRTIFAYNRHLPSEQAPYVFGDPRGLFNKGVHVELTTALHAEAAVIGRAAREGISTEGAKLYVTAFPCPFCANVLSESGISEIYFHSGYSMLDGAALLAGRGIKLFRVIE